MKNKTASLLPNAILAAFLLAAFLPAAFLSGQTEAGSVPPKPEGPNLKPKPAPGELPLPLLPAQVDPKAVADFDAAVAAMKPVPNDIDLKVEVIGLDIRQGSAQEKQLTDIAAAGAGQYYGVQDAAKLSGVFAQVAAGSPAPPVAAGGGGGGGGLILQKSGLSGMAVAAIALGILSLALLIGVAILRGRRTAGPGAARIGGRLTVLFPDGRSSSFAIRAPVTSLGRAGDNAVVLDDEQVSGHHAEIVAARDGFRIRDLQSSNGTFVRGERITDVPVYSGDEITVGSTRIVLEG
ncbi:MAG: FHA domain-containing protein [Candidatus Aminicenantes bacterium]|nr:FHA domain-containing protein [Candidatus Aminicenantes bacterium]